jgi:hypothetical protein
MKKMLLAFAGLAAVAISSAPASAAVLTTNCNSALSVFDPASTQCVGFFQGNLLNDPGSDAQAAAIAAFGVDFTDWQDYDLPGIKVELTDTEGELITFSEALFGQVVIGIHFGGGVFDPNWQGGGTGFFLFNFNEPTTSIVLNAQSGSAAVLYQNGVAVPEPATWAMMLMGFGAAGFAVRRRRRTTVLAQLA